MSTLQVTKIHLESTGNNRIQYTGSNSYILVAGGANVAVINTSAISFPTETSFNDLTITGNSSLIGSATFSNTVAVTGNATFSNTISVTGSATFSNTVAVTGNATFSNTVAVTGNATFSNTISVTEVQAKAYIETVVALSGTTPTIDCDEGNIFTLTTSGDTTFTFSYAGVQLTTDDAYAFTLRVTAGGTHTLTWPASVDWAGGTAPDAPASGETDVFVFFTHDGGTTWYGFLAGDAMA